VLIVEDAFFLKNNHFKEDLLNVSNRSVILHFQYSSLFPVFLCSKGGGVGGRITSAAEEGSAFPRAEK